MSDFLINDARFAGFIMHNAPVEKLATGFRWVEGPVWFGDAGCLLFSDIPNNRIMRWIEGVGTSVAGIVGPTRSGPVRGTPEVVTSSEEFERIFGDSKDLDFGGTKVVNHTAIAARNFFDNRGKQLYVTRVFKDVNVTDADGSGGSAVRASRATDGGERPTGPE